jgi:PST family polysaccharide transporter
MLIGWWWGETSLGFYERGYKLMMAPLIQINLPLRNLVVPALSRVQDQPAKYRKAYFQAAGLFQVVSCPLMAFVAVTSPWVVDIIFGQGWEEVAPILRWLAISGFLQPIISSLGWLYISQGRTRELMIWGFIGCSLILLSFLIGLPWGPLGVARSYALVICLLIVPMSYWYAGCRGPVSTRDLWRLTGSALLYAAPVVLISGIVTLRFPHLTPAVGLAVSGLLSAVASMAVVLGTRSGREMFNELRSLLHHAIPIRWSARARGPRGPAE